MIYAFVLFIAPVSNITELPLFDLTLEKPSHVIYQSYETGRYTLTLPKAAPKKTVKRMTLREVK